MGIFISPQMALVIVSAIDIEFKKMFSPRRDEEHSAAKPQPTRRQNFLLKKQEDAVLFHRGGNLVGAR
jgi:hypothetical protein